MRPKLRLYDADNIEAAKKALSVLEPRQADARMMVEALRESIEAALNKGATWREISFALRSTGVNVSLPTIQKYFKKDRS